MLTLTKLGTLANKGSKKKLLQLSLTDSTRSCEIEVSAKLDR